jgi:hypothetical protein
MNGFTPRPSKKFPVTSSPRTVRVSPSVAMFQLLFPQAKTWEKASCPSASARSCGSVKLARRLRNRPVRPLPLDGQGSHPDRVHQLEDRGVGAGAEREREDGDDREGRVLQQDAHAIPKVLPCAVDEPERIHVVDVLTDVGPVAEPQMGLSPRFVCRHAAGDVVVDLVGQVVLQLPGAFLVPARTAEEAGPGHDASTAPRRPAAGSG